MSQQSLTSRIGALIGGSIDAFVTKLENDNPEIVMNQGIKEIEDLIAEARTELGKKMAHRTSLKKSHEIEEKRHAGLTEQIKIAVEQSRDDLAKAGINKQIAIEAQLNVIGDNLGLVSHEVGELENMVRALQARRDEYVEQVKIHAESNAANVSNDLLAKAEQVESSFQRIQSKATNLRLGIDDPNTVDELQQLQQLSQENAVNQRLAAFKQSTTNPAE